MQIGGGGYVTGIVAHPMAKDLVCIRTDVGGAFKWNRTKGGWIPLSDGLDFDNKKHYNIESIALDPADTMKIYVASGGEWSYWDKNGAIMVSDDQGKTWQKTGLTNIAVGGNEDWRWGGERLVVDPNNSNVTYFGSRQNGQASTVKIKPFNCNSIVSRSGCISFKPFLNSKIDILYQLSSEC